MFETFQRKEPFFAFIQTTHANIYKNAFRRFEREDRENERGKRALPKIIATFTANFLPKRSKKRAEIRAPAIDVQRDSTCANVNDNSRQNCHRESDRDAFSIARCHARKQRNYSGVSLLQTCEETHGCFLSRKKKKRTR